MAIHSRFTPVLAVIGVLTLGGASTVRAQDTSAAAGTDTALKAKPGVQTGPAASDTGNAARKGAAGTADTVVCKDGSNTANKKKACKTHGGIDWTATEAALKARGGRAGESAESTAAPTDTTQVNKSGAAGYRYTGQPSDTALNAKPGTQTGPDTGAGKKSDTSSSNR
jgi:hypothetical protein